MARFRLFDPVPQWRDALGVMAAGGSLVFTDSGTTTPRNVYSADTGGVSLGSTLTLDSDARLSEDFWLDGEYRVVLKDADGATIWTRDNVRDVASDAAAIPDASDGTDGQALFTDGTPGGFYWDDVLTIPSQTGNGGKYLTTDGEALSWAGIETYDEDSLPGGVTQTSTSFQIGKFKVQAGSGTVPSNASGVTSSVAITFAEAYTTLLHVSVTPSGGSGSTPQGLTPTLRVVGTGTGATVYAYAGDEHDDPPGWYLTSSTAFTYVAFGIVA